MNRAAASLLFRGLTLLPQRGVWEAATRTLWIADLHLGKAASFRALGQPAPAGTTDENLRRLGALTDAMSARRLIVLGDFLHGREAHDGALPAKLRAWKMARGDLRCVVVRGNHDQRAGDIAGDCGFVSVDAPYSASGVEARHFPLGEAAALADGPTVLAGHLHPVGRLHGLAHDSIRLPCFAISGRQIVLPAFGEFTGGRPLRAGPQVKLVATTDTELVEIGGARGKRWRADPRRPEAAIISP